MRTCSVFDLDGVLIDSHLAVREAYGSVGVQMPHSAWGEPWEAWLIDVCGGDEEEAERLHIEKCKVYPSMLSKFGRVLPLTHVLKNLVRRRMPVYILTGASYDGAVAALKLCGINMALLYDYGLTPRQKSEILETIASSHFEVGVYYDDQDGVVVPSGWAKVQVIE